MTSGIKILLLEDNPVDAEIIKRLLKKEASGNEFLLVMTREAFVRALEEYKPDVIVSDNSLPQFDASEALRILRARSLFIPFILVTGTVSEEFAAGIIKSGADDYILKDRLTRLPTAIDAALQKRQSELEKKEAEEELHKSNERFYYATMATSDIIWELNFETKEYLVHDGKGKSFGVNTIHDWQLGIDSGYIIEEDRDEVRDSFRKARMDTSVRIWKQEYGVKPDSNDIMYVINHAVFIRDDYGQATRVIGAITDITQRKKLEKDLLEQQRSEQLRLTSTAIEAQERERNHIGQELHDNVNQILVGTMLALSSVREQKEKTSEIIRSSIDNLKNAIGENRKIAHELVAPDLNQQSLIEQLHNLANDMFHGNDISVYINTSHFDEDLLNGQRRLAVYRVAQEQCMNIVKYAGATEVAFSLETADDTFKMSIVDNGKGMDMNKATKGIGLQNIGGRIGVFNGKVNIHTKPGKGFTLEIEMPL